MHLAFSKSLSNGTVAITTAGNWDGLKYQLSKLDYHETGAWDQSNFAWSQFEAGDIIKDEAYLWRYLNIEVVDVYDKEIFDGRIVFLSEIDPVFDKGDK